MIKEGYKYRVRLLRDFGNYPAVQKGSTECFIMRTPASAPLMLVKDNLIVDISILGSLVENIDYEFIVPRSPGDVVPL